MATGTRKQRDADSRLPDSQAQRTFLDQLAKGRTVTYASEQTGRARQRFYELRHADEQFAQQWDDAYERGTDTLRDEIRRRAVDGWDEPVFQGGKQVGTVRKFSDTLLIFEAKRRDPAYRDNHRVELTGRDGGPMEVTNPDVAAAIERFTATVQRLTERAESSGDVRPVGPGPAELAAGDTRG